jgi:hypothetical protein
MSRIDVCYVSIFYSNTGLISFSGKVNWWKREKYTLWKPVIPTGRDVFSYYVIKLVA